MSVKINKTGRPDHINNALAKLHKNYWYKYTSKDQVYANLILNEKIGVGGVLIDNPVTELPSEEEVNAKLKELQDAWDLEHAEYKENRRKAYARIPDQLDQLYHDIDDGKLGNDAKTGSWYLAVKTIKDNNPKG